MTNSYKQRISAVLNEFAEAEAEAESIQDDVVADLKERLDAAFPGHEFTVYGSAPTYEECLASQIDKLTLKVDKVDGIWYLTNGKAFYSRRGPRHMNELITVCERPIPLADIDQVIMAFIKETGIKAMMRIDDLIWYNGRTIEGE